MLKLIISVLSKVVEIDFTHQNIITNLPVQQNSVYASYILSSSSALTRQSKNREKVWWKDHSIKDNRVCAAVFHALKSPYKLGFSLTITA